MRKKEYKLELVRLQVLISLRDCMFEQILRAYEHSEHKTESMNYSLECYKMLLED